MNEAYVSFETAKLLKEKGFDWPWPCICYYEDNGIIHKALDYVRQNDGDDDDNNECLCPTQQMACDWVEKTYGFFIEVSRHIDLNGNYHYFYMILDKECKYASPGTHDNNYPSKSDAIEAALEYVLKNLI